MSKLLAHDVNLPELACPNCLSEALTVVQEVLSCESCGQRYAITDGIPVLRERPAVFDWGVPADRVEQMLEDIPRLGWHDAMMRLSQDLAPEQAELLWLRAFGYRRLALQMLLPMGRTARVLDLGCGWGTVAWHLADFCGEVVAFDQVQLHLRWLRAVCDEQNLRNVTLVQGGDTKRLPFPDESFDAVILNGVLEHVALNRPGDPTTVQQGFLREVARVLTPQGVVYIGIENRLNYKYFLGVREGHIKMKYGALLPRRLTRWYLAWRRHQPFRQYTYSLFGYRNLLTKAGLTHQRFFAPWPTYSSAGDFFPVEETRRTPLWMVQSTHLIAHRPGWYVTRAYAMTASKDRPAPALIERVLREIALRAAQPLPWPLKHCVFRASSGGKATMTIKEPSWSIQVGLTKTAASRIAAQYRALTALHSLELPDELKRRIPRPIMTGEIDGFLYAVRTFASGTNAAAMIANERTREIVCGQAEAFLSRLHLVGGQLIRVNETWFGQLFARPFSTVQEWFTADEWPTHKPWFDQRLNWIKSHVMDSPLRVVPYHGDFAPENCVWDRSSAALVQVVDWELFEPAGLPMIDWQEFLGCAYRPQVKATMRARGEDPARVKFHGYPAMFLEEPLRGTLHRYLDRLGVSRTLLPPLLFMWWIRQLHDWAPLLLYHPDWRRLRVFPVIERWNQLLRAGGFR